VMGLSPEFGMDTVLTEGKINMTAVVGNPYCSYPILGYS